jgi:hypothetical protein
MNKVFIAIGALVFIVTGLVALVSIHRGSGLVVPGLPAVSYSKDELVPLKVNKITSHHTQVPFAYFTMDGVCKTNRTEEPENIGDIIMGDVSIEHSGYNVRFAIQSFSAVPLSSWSLTRFSTRFLSNAMLSVNASARLRN